MREIRQLVNPSIRQFRVLFRVRSGRRDDPQVRAERQTVPRAEAPVPVSVRKRG